MTGSGKSSFVNFITGTNKCLVSNSASPCTQEFKMVESVYMNKTLYFADTPGLDDPDGDKKNIKELLKIRNAYPRINTIIYCQKLDDNKFSNSAKILFKLMKDLYYEESFSHLIVVRTKSSRTDPDFESDKQASIEFINKLKTEFSIKEEKVIPQYYVDSKYKDNDSRGEKEDILNKLEKMDPIFMKVNKQIHETIVYDTINNRYEIKETITSEYVDFDGSKNTYEEKNTEIQDFNEIKKVEVERYDINTSQGILWCKSWIIIYVIYHINGKNERIKSRDIQLKQSDRKEDKSNMIKSQEERRLKLNK